MALLDYRYREGYSYTHPLQGDFLSQNYAYGALCANLEYLIAQNRSTLLREYKSDQFADSDFTSKQLEIIEALYFRHNKSFSNEYFGQEKPDIYQRTEQLMYLNQTPRVAPTARLPITAIRITGEPVISVDHSPRQKRADLNPLPLPIIHSLAADALISWGAGRPPLTATIRERASHTITKPANYDILGIYYLAQIQIDLSETSNDLVYTEIKKVSRSSSQWNKLAISTNGSKGKTYRKHLDTADGGDDPNRPSGDY